VSAYRMPDRLSLAERRSRGRANDLQMMAKEQGLRA
jgi:hypothetical protein